MPLGMGSSLPPVMLTPLRGRADGWNGVASKQTNWSPFGPLPFVLVQLMGHTAQASSPCPSTSLTTSQWLQELTTHPTGLPSWGQAAHSGLACPEPRRPGLPLFCLKLVFLSQ